MNAKFVLLSLTTVVLTFSLSVWAEDKAESQPKTVQDMYPGLTSGALSLAVPNSLPEGILLMAGDIEIASESISEIINAQPKQNREEFKKNAFFILEQEATNKLLLGLARKTSTLPAEESSAQEESALIQQFFEKEVFKTIEVTEEEINVFYENNKEMCGGATLVQAAASIKNYLISQKKQEMVSDYIQSLGQQIPIRISEDWVKKQAVLAFDNPVDKARQSKKPSMVDFGVDGCKPCDMMTPILETLGKKYAGKANVLFVHVREQQVLASRYGIQSIPVQVFFDADGKEVFRHVGFFAQDEVEKKLNEIGVQ